MRGLQLQIPFLSTPNQPLTPTITPSVLKENKTSRLEAQSATSDIALESRPAQFTPARSLKLVNFKTHSGEKYYTR